MTFKIHKISSSINSDVIVFDASTDQWSIDSELDISSYVKEQDIVVDNSVELVDAFDLDAGGIELELQYNSAVWTYLYNSTYIENDAKGYILSITLDSTSIFWGGIAKDSITKSFVEDTITFSAHNMYKTIIDSIKHRIVKSPATTTSDLQEYLIEYFDGDLIDDVVINLKNVNLELDTDYLATLSTNGLTVGAFMKEVQKQFACFFYVTPDKYLTVTNRGYETTTTTTIDSLIENNNYFLYPELSEYNSVLCHSVTENWDSFGGVPGDVPTHDWVLIHETNGTQEAIFLYGDLDNIPAKFNYLDLRQKLYYNATSEEFEISTAWKLFSFVEGGTFDSYDFDYNDTWDLYENVTHDQEVVSCVYNGVNLNLFDKVSLGGNTYLVFSASKNYTKTSTDLILKRLI